MQRFLSAETDFQIFSDSLHLSPIKCIPVTKPRFLAKMFLKYLLRAFTSILVTWEPAHSLVFCVKVQDSRIAEQSHFHIKTLHLLPWPCEIKHEMHGFFSKLNILAGIMRYFKILMIEHLNNSLWLEILRGMNCMFRGGRSLTSSEDQNFCFSSFNIWKFSENAQTPTFDLQKIVPGNRKETLECFVKF